MAKPPEAAEVADLLKLKVVDLSAPGKRSCLVEVQSEHTVDTVLQAAATSFFGYRWYESHDCHLLLPESPDVYLAPTLPLSLLTFKDNNSVVYFQQGRHPNRSGGKSGEQLSPTSSVGGQSLSQSSNSQEQTRQAILAQALQLISTPSSLELREMAIDPTSFRTFSPRVTTISQSSATTSASSAPSVTAMAVPRLHLPSSTPIVYTPKSTTSSSSSSSSPSLPSTSGSSATPSLPPSSSSLPSEVSLSASSSSTPRSSSSTPRGGSTPRSKPLAEIIPKEIKEEIAANSYEFKTEEFVYWRYRNFGKPPPSDSARRKRFGRAVVYDRLLLLFKRDKMRIRIALGPGRTRTLDVQADKKTFTLLLTDSAAKIVFHFDEHEPMFRVIGLLSECAKQIP